MKYNRNYFIIRNKLFRFAKMKTICDYIEYRNETERYRDREQFNPVLTDQDYLPELYYNVLHAVDEHGGKYRASGYFYLIATALYCPDVFKGETLKSGFRKKLAFVTGVSGSYVSKELNKMYKWMELYQDFADSMEWVYDEVIKSIKKNNDVE